MLTIRREEPDDAEAIARVHVHGWQAGYAGIMPEEVLSRLNPRAWAQRRRDLGTADPEHPFTTLVAEDGGTIVGFTTFGPYRNNQDRGDLDPALTALTIMSNDEGVQNWFRLGSKRRPAAIGRAMADLVVGGLLAEDRSLDDFR